MDDRCHDTSHECRALTRRCFLAGAGAAAAGLTGTGFFSRCLRQARAESPTDLGDTFSKVVEVRSDHVIKGRIIHPGLLRDMLRIGLGAVTGHRDEKQAWSSILSSDDVIGLKFNQSGAAALGVTPPMVETLMASLTEAGWDPAQIVPIEAPRGLQERLGTTSPRQDWLPDEVPFGEARDRLCGVLEQVTAIINVPFLKHHNIAGMTGCLKNLSHALVKHPARFHRNKCTPYIGDIVALPKIRSKLRLHVVNALRIVIDKGPDARAPYIIDRGALLLGLDPVAVDSLGLEILNRVRRNGGLGKIEDHQGPVLHLAAAAARGLGCHQLHQIQYVRHRL